MSSKNMSNSFVALTGTYTFTLVVDVFNIDTISIILIKEVCITNLYHIPGA